MLNASQARCLIFTLVVINAMYAPGASALSKAAAPAPHHQHRRAGDLSHGSNQMRRARRSTSSHQQRDGVALLAASAVPSATPVIQVPAAAISGSAAHTTNTTCPVGLHKGLLSNNGIYIGFLPDNGDSGGSYQSPVALDKALGRKAASIGLYAHLREDIPFDCVELTDIGGSLTAVYSGLGTDPKTPSEIKDYKKDALLEAVVKAGGVFVASAMPLYGWGGLTKKNNTQAVRLAKCMKRFSDRGVPVWLRFGHEMNYYQSAGSASEQTLNGQQIYAGTPADYQEGWATVAAAVKKHAPCVKMYWSPNAGDEAAMSPYWPADEHTVDIIGVDWYPNDGETDLVSQYKWMHDKWASSKRPFTLGETGLGGSDSDKQALMTAFSSPQVAKAMPHFKLINWFNYNKGTCFMLAGGCGSANAASYFKAMK